MTVEHLKPGDPGGIAGLRPRYVVRVTTEGPDGLDQEFARRDVIGWTVEYHGVLSLTLMDGTVELFANTRWLRASVKVEP